MSSLNQMINYNFVSWICVNVQQTILTFRQQRHTRWRAVPKIKNILNPDVITIVATPIYNCKKKHTIVATPSTIVYEVLTIVVWSVFLYPCLYVAVTCPPMNLTEYMLYISNISVPGDAYYHVNDTIQLGCVRGYEIQPSAVYECQKTGSWNVSSVPSCKRKYQLPNACS